MTRQEVANTIRAGEWNRRQALIWAKQYPVHMIVQPVTAAGLPTWGLVVKSWSFSNVGGFVKGLCAR